MNATALARRYALTLLETAEERGVLTLVVADVERLRATILGSSELAAFLGNRLFAGALHERALQALFADKVQPLTRDFLQLVTVRRRGDLLAEILAEFAALAEERAGSVSAVVRSAVPIETAQLERLRQRLGQFSGKDVRLENEVDPSVGSGAVVRLGDTVMDGTVATRLERLRQRLVGA